jgi:ubiquinone/menaquinone biosynthesis C-methylase UbiE
MGNTQEWWDDFWKKQSSPHLFINEKDGTWYDLVWKASLEHWHDLFGRLAPGKNMLECGCGSARVSQYMARQGYKCTLLDSSEKAISLAKNSFESLALDGRFMIGDINQLCLGDEQFDVVFSGGVLEFFDDVQKPINEMVRVLKPGGIFSANIVPNKFSIQTLADIERTVVCSIGNLMKGRYRDVFKRVQQIPPDYNVNSLSLQEYINICKNTGLTSVVGLVTSPFPALALPRFAGRFYAHIMKRLCRQWLKFDQSKSRWTEIWGIAYTIYGIKKASML